jgi:hypothetical protein
MISIRFHQGFGLHIESVQSQPVLGWGLDESIEEAQVYFFDGIILNLPFMKIHIGEVFDYFS